MQGKAAIPTSKSLTNRALIAAAAADGGRVLSPLDCDDTRYLAKALGHAGWQVVWSDDIEIRKRRSAGYAEVDLGNSGTGSRLLLGLLASVRGSFLLDGSERLRQRPMAPLIEALRDIGADITDCEGFLPVRVDGKRLPGGFVRIRPHVSSQFVSSLLLAGPLMTDGITVEILGRVPSRPYLDLTTQVLSAFGATVEAVSDYSWRVGPGGLSPTRFEVEGDWSAAAFVAASVAVAGGSVWAGPLSESSRQGDRAICRILEEAGLEIEWRDSGVVFSGQVVRPIEADLADTPDLFPALSVVAAAAPVGSRLTGLDHLKHKESDRLSTMVDNLTRLGACFENDGSSVRVLRGLPGEISRVTEMTAADDHRIAMAMAVASLVTGRLVLDDGDCVSKSFPGFWAMWDGLVQRATD
jgi:3-phosphoshikimate 1-carboxyvinyltransferase